MLKRVDFDIGDITPEEARRIQYRLGKDISVYRVFIDPYRKNGFIIFDEEKNIDILREIDHGIEIKNEEKITVEELINRSL